MPVEIQENEVKTATAAEGIHYPALSSCMSITCILSNGSKVGAHAFQFGDYGITLINRMKALVGNNVVVAVKAKGHGGLLGKSAGISGGIGPHRSSAMEKCQSHNRQRSNYPGANTVSATPVYYR
ncbi:hypothetical protein [Dickeya oryzae]